MENSLKKYKSLDLKTWGNIVLKGAFICFTVLFFYQKLIQSNEFSSSWTIFTEHIRSGKKYYLFFVVVLIPLNWAIESYKWKKLAKPFLKLSFLSSFKAVLCGVSIAMLTPNRIGEYGGRMMAVESKYNWKTVISTLISSFAQNIWNIGLGCLALFLYLYQIAGWSAFLSISGTAISGLAFLFLLFLYYNLDTFILLLKKKENWAFIRRLLKECELIDRYDKNLLSDVLFLALLRYSIYFFQYYLILHFFGLKLSFQEAFLSIGTIFLIQTSLPLPPVLGFLARGELALIVFSIYSFPSLNILGASYSLWMLNILIPALVGSIIVINRNLFQNLGFDKLRLEKLQKLF